MNQHFAQTCARRWWAAAMMALCLIFTTEQPSAGTPDYNLSLLSNVAQPINGPRDIWGWVHPVDGREYALLCMGASLDIYEVTTPTAPVLRASVASLGSDLKDAKTMGRYAYVANQFGPIQVIDLFDLPASARTVGTLIFRGSGAHNFYIDSVRQLAYLGMNGAGDKDVHILDLSVPTQPTTAAKLNQFGSFCMEATGDTHDAWGEGNVAYYASLGAGLLVVDMTNKNNPTFISQHHYPGNFTHNVWPSADRNYVYTTDENPGGHLRVFDVRDPHQIRQVGFYRAGTNTIIHNVHVRDTLAFLAYYTEGVKVVNISDPEVPVEVASFDTHPQPTVGSFDGCWGVFPYLPSGVILASDRINGLFLLALDEVSPGRLAGTISDQAGEPVPGARVNIMNTTLEAFTDNTGAYSLPALNGTGLVSVFRSGYTAFFQQVTMAQNTTTSFSPVLARESGALVSGFAQTSDGRIDTLRISVRNHFFDPVHPAADMSFKVGNTLSGAQVIGAYAWGYKPAEKLIDVGNSPVSVVLELGIGFEDNFEWDQGWRVGDVSATGGVWERAVPYVKSPLSSPAQPGADHGVGADSRCWLTGATPPGGFGGSLGGGSATLYSPTLDLSGYSDPHVNYWRWYADNDDNFPIVEGFAAEVSSDGGNSWIKLESTTQRRLEWVERDFRLVDFVPLTSNIRFRFIAGNECQTASVEAALDDFRVYDADPARCCERPGDSNSDGRRNISDITFILRFLFSGGGAGQCQAQLDADASGTVNIADVTALIDWLFRAGPSPRCP